MIKIDNTITPSSEQWKTIILGARNPLNSWGRSDSRQVPGMLIDEQSYEKAYFEIGPNDKNLMKRLRMAGTDHRKFMRMIAVYVDITAPLYLWKEIDTYQVGVVKNSCSTMHKIHAKEFELSDFSTDKMLPRSIQSISSTINDLNYYRNIYLNGGDICFGTVEDTVHYEPKNKDIWWQMIQLLPSSYNQKRAVMLNYEVLTNMYKSRKNHKLDEWRELCEWMRGLPYSELITGEFEE